MSAFSPDWLALREPADQRARNADLAGALAARFSLRDTVTVIDLGSGTGANLRATSSLLPSRQSWTLIDIDPALLDTARRALIRWADRSDEAGDVLQLEKDNRTIDVIFKLADLARDDALLADRADLVTGSAFFDLVSKRYIQRLSARVTDMKAVFYAVLTYNGLQRWTPHRPSDNQMAAAFHRHQLREKGFGLAAGPMAAPELADQFRLNGYLVMEGDSPWHLDRGDRMLVDELARGHALAASETASIDKKTIVTWLGTARTGASVGHTDTLAVPA